MTTARESALTVIDFESTGTVEGYPDEPWQIGLVAFRDGRVAQDSRFESLLRVDPRPFNPYAPGRHAELRAELASAPALLQLWPALRPWLFSDALCAHNASTERRFLKREFPMFRGRRWVDTLKLTRIAYPGLPSYKLEDLIVRLGLKARVDAACPGREPHDALYDAVACGLLLETLLESPRWHDVTLETLVHAQRGAAP